MKIKINFRKVYSILIFMLTLTLVAGAFAGCSVNSTIEGSEQCTVPSKAPNYWPTEGWKSTTPEAQGMDSAKIAEMFETIEMYNYDIHHALVIRNGYKVAECNYAPYAAEDVHNVFSITKSVTSSLIGIAIEEGKIKSLDDKVLSYFPDRTVQNPSDFKKDMSIQNLLTMSGGMDWSENGDYSSSTNSTSLMYNSPDSLQYMLDLPVIEAPGTTFNYSTGSTHILSGILSQGTQMPTETYANEKIWDPLGIKTAFWGTDNKGLNCGGSRSLYTASDLAKFGYLYLNNGQWDGQQLIPEAWVSESTSKHIDTPNGPAGRYGYGYQWWMNDFGGYSARGYAGQYLFVLPEQNLVVVCFGSLQGNNFFKPEKFMKDYLLPACVSVEAIPENEASQKRLQELISKAEAPAVPQAILPIPAITEQTNGKIFDTENGEKIGIDFENGKDTAMLHWLTDGVQYDVPVGLDNVYRFSDCKDFYLKNRVSKTGLKGTWANDTTFLVEIRPLESDCSYTLTLRFSDRGISTSFEAN